MRSPWSKYPRSVARWLDVYGGTAWLIRLALALAGVVVAAAVIEVGVRLFMPTNLDFYNWQKIKRVSDRPGHPFEYIPGARNDFYVGVPVQINSLGLRDVEIEIPKPAATVRILVIGDSITFGYGVRLEETFLKVLESDLNAGAQAARYQVVNGGMDGSGLDRHYSFQQSSADGLEPDLVIVALSLNDIADYRRRGRVRETRAFAERGLVRRLNTFLLFHSQAYLASYLRLKSMLYRYGVLDYNQEHWYEAEILKPSSAEMKEAWISTREILSNIVALARNRGYPVGLVIFPMEVQLDRSSLERYRRELGWQVAEAALGGEPQQELLRFGTSIGVPVVDLLPAFRAARDSELFLRGRSMSSDPVHPSPDGHRVAAQALLRFLKEEPSFAPLWSPGNGPS